MANSLKVNCQVTRDAASTVGGTSSPKTSENKIKRIERPSIGSGPDEIVYQILDQHPRTRQSRRTARRRPGNMIISCPIEGFSMIYKEKELDASCNLRVCGACTLRVLQVVHVRRIVNPILVFITKWVRKFAGVMTELQLRSSSARVYRREIWTTELKSRKSCERS